MDLVRAMKMREQNCVATLRAVLAAIDNAESVEVDSAMEIALGNATGSATEVPRKELSGCQILAIVERELEERRAAAEEYERLAQYGEAARLRAAVQIIARYVAGWTGDGAA